MLSLDEKVKYVGKIILENKENGKISIVSKDWNVIICTKKTVNELIKASDDINERNQKVYESSLKNSTNHFNLKRLILKLLEEGKPFTVIDQEGELVQMMKHFGDQVKVIHMPDSRKEYFCNVIEGNIDNI